LPFLLMVIDIKLSWRFTVLDIKTRSDLVKRLLF